MGKDAKGHGSNKKLLGQTGRTAKEYDEHLRSSGSPETMARKRASAEAAERERKATYKAGRAAQAAENRKIMGPTTGKAAQNMRDLVRAKIEDGKIHATTKNQKY